MHRQQTKVGSRATGGPQYYFHDLPDVIKDHLRRKGACPVILQTPYGLAVSPYKAVGRDHKLDAPGRLMRGRVGHDRIQQATAQESIGEAIRKWFALPAQVDFQRIEIDVELHVEGHFILSPTKVSLRGRKRAVDISKPHHALSFHGAYQAPVWREQLQWLVRSEPEVLTWGAQQIQRVLDEHKRDSINIHEADLLRASGALSKLGLYLSAYRLKGLDCPESRFQFLDYPCYPCPVEIKKSSHGFKYQMLRHYPLPRAVILCARHELMNPPDHVDVIDLSTLAAYLREPARLG